MWIVVVIVIYLPSFLFFILFFYGTLCVFYSYCYWRQLIFSYFSECSATISLIKTIKWKKEWNEDEKKEISVLNIDIWKLITERAKLLLDLAFISFSCLSLQAPSLLVSFYFFYTFERLYVSKTHHIPL